MEASGLTDSEFGEGRSREEMTYPYGENTFVDWDFRRVWGADKNHSINSGYPYLRMEKEECGCCGAGTKGLTLKQSFEHFLGDWLVLGLAAVTLAALGRRRL